jgi:serralysin
MAAAKTGYTVTQNTTLNIPVLDSPTFNTTFTDNATSTLKADLATAAPVLAYDNNGDLVMTYTFDVSPSISNGETVTELTSTQKAMDRLALQAISDVAKIKFVEVNSSTASKANLVFGNVPDLGSSAAQAVTTPSSTGSEISKATVEFSLAASTNADGTIGKYGYTTALHEISHALGIKHPRSYGSGGASSTEPFLLAAKDSNQYSLMSYNKHPYTENNIAFYSNSAAVSPKTLLLYDVAALQLLYGANSTYKTGNDTYHWDADVDPFMTIWDVDGTDTIDVSNQTQVQTIDLRTGYFSSLGAVKIAYSNGSTTTHAPKDNVSIAYGTVIENAIGSNQNDTIIGNSVANVLTGNAGNDNFVFTSVLSTNNVDTITDFSSGDKITLSKSIFTALNSGSVLTADEFLAGSGKTVAETSLQRIIFDTLTKNLYYDADGLNGNNPVQFAILSNVSELNAGQLFLQA